MKSSRFAVIASSLLLISGCGELKTEFNTPTSLLSTGENSEEKIIDANDLIPVDATASNVPEEFRPLIGAVGQLNVGCTATHVGNGFVLTAGHCISVSPRSNPKSCSLLGVVWGNYGGNTQLTASKCLSIVARSYDKNADYALLRVAQPPAAAVEIDFSLRDLSQTNAITLFSFPRMRPMEWSGLCDTQRYPQPESLWMKFLHTCDTESGSSGGALIDATTGKIVGIHGGSTDTLNYATSTAVLSGLKELILRQSTYQK